METSDDPFLLPLALGALGVGTFLQVKGTLQEGKDAQKIAEAQAAIDIENSKLVREASVEEARIKAEERVKGKARIRSAIATGNVRLGGPLDLVLVAAENAERTKDIGFGLERGREESDFFESRAALTLASGKAARKRSKTKALTKGLLGFGSLAIAGIDAGIFSRAETPFNAVDPLTGQVGFAGF